MLVGWKRTCECDPDFSQKDGSGKLVPAMELDHYNKCPNPGLPRPYVFAAYSDAVAMRYDRKGWVPSASQITACPIETALKVNTDYIEDIYDDRRFMLRGTFAHEGFYSRLKDHPDYLCEQEIYLPMGDFSVFGTLDAYYKPSGTIEDYKTQGEFPLKKKMSQTDTEMVEDPRTGSFVRDNMNQINVYAALVREVLDLPVNHLRLYYVDGMLRFRPFDVPIVDHARMMTVMRDRFTTLYEAVHGLKPLEEIQSKYESINQFPANKSPVRYLLQRYIG